MNSMSKDLSHLQIEGYGGGKDGGGSSTPSEDTDSLRSTQIADVTDLISEGQCGGPANGLKSVFLDGVPIQNADGSYNFSGVDWAWTPGTQGQAALPGLGGAENTLPVSVQVLAATPIVRTITNAAIDTVRVTIGIPQLSSQDLSTGDLHGSSVEWAIDVQSKGGGYVQRYRRTVSGKNMSLYTKSVSVALNGGAPYDIRVRRISPDSTTSSVVNAFSWIAYSEIQSVKQRYPHSAVSRIRVDAQQFSRIPVRSFDWKGRYLQVPSNYDPVTRIYTGTWDGTFKLAWSDNPAWALYLIITHPRFGLGEYVDPAINNKWALYQIGRYCDGLVPDGRGGMEPRFTCNLVLGTRAEAYQVLRDLSALFRGMVYWGNGAVEYAQDAPAEAELLYTPANVVDSVFTYQDSSEKTQHSVFIAYWNDLSQQGKSVPEVYAPDDLIARYGVREMSMQLIGCTSRGQAARMCRWARYTEQHEGTVVAFRVGSDGQIAAPGKVFKIADPSEQGERLGGRIVSATRDKIKLDASVALLAGETYTITVIQARPNDAGEVAAAGVPVDAQLRTITETRSVTTPSGVATDELSVSPSFSVAPQAQTIWVLQSNGIQATYWRCLGVKEITGKNQFEISAISHNPSKYDAIELGLQLEEPNTSRLKAVVAPPTSLQLLETVYTDGTTNRSRLTASWVPSAPYLHHTVMWRRDTSWWQKLPITSAQTVDIGPLDPGVYEVKITSTNALGNTSQATQASIQIAGGPSGIRAVRLKASSSSFKVSSAGVATPASITIEADIGGLTGPVQWAVTSGQVSMLSVASDGLSATVAYADLTTEAATIQARVTDHGQDFTDLVTVFKVRDGAPGYPGQPGEAGVPGDAGQPAVSAQLSLDVIALPANGSGAVTSYAGAFTSLVIWMGDTIDVTGWTFTRIDGPGVDSTITGATLEINSVTAATDASYVDITGTKAGVSPITKRVVIVKSKSGPAGDAGDPGQRGSVQLAKEVSATSWSDADANNALTSAGYAGPVNQDVVTLYNSAAEWSEARVYTAGAWLTINAYISGNLLVSGTVSAEKLSVSQLSAIAADLGSITAGTLSAGTIFGGTVLAGSLDVQKLSGVSSSYTTPGFTFQFTVPSGFTTVKITLRGAGGGAGYGISNAGGGGGGQGGLTVVTLTSVPAGAIITSYIGRGGLAAPLEQSKNTPNTTGQPGEATTAQIAGSPTVYSAGGGQPGANAYRPIDANGAIGRAPGAGGAGGVGSGSGSNGASGEFGFKPVILAGEVRGNGLGGGDGYGSGGDSNFGLGQDGSGGQATIEAYNPNGVVLRDEWNTLMSSLRTRSQPTSSYTWPQ